VASGDLLRSRKQARNLLDREGNNPPVTGRRRFFVVVTQLPSSAQPP